MLSAIHDLTLAGQFADRLLLLANGRIAASGPASEVLREGVLSNHFGPGMRVMTTEDGDLAVVLDAYLWVPDKTGLLSRRDGTTQ